MTGPEQVEKILATTGELESNNTYNAFVDKDRKALSSVGRFMFNQLVGGLQEVMSKMHRTDPDAFNRLVKIDPATLADRRKFKAVDFTQPELKKQIKALFNYPKFRAVQDTYAVEAYLKPLTRRSAIKRNASTLATYMVLFDCSIQCGPGWTMKTFTQIESDLEPMHFDTSGLEKAMVQKLAKTADDYSGTKRRVQIMAKIEQENLWSISWAGLDDWLSARNG